MNTKVFFLIDLAFWLICPLEILASWNDPVVTVSPKALTRQDVLSVQFRNATNDTYLGIFRATTGLEFLKDSIAVTPGNGEKKIKMSFFPSSHEYGIALFTYIGGRRKCISPVVPFVVTSNNLDLSFHIDKKTYGLNETVEINYQNAPACKGDFWGAFDLTDKILQKATPAFTTDAVAVDSVEETAGTARFSFCKAGYYSLRYYLEDDYSSIYASETIMVGRPATIKAEKSDYLPEENITINYTGLSFCQPDWIGVFKDHDEVTTARPLYQINLKGHQRGCFSIPAHTLQKGKYQIAAFYNSTRTLSSKDEALFGIAAGANSPQFLHEDTMTLYTIQNTATGLMMTDETSDSDTLTNVSLAMPLKGNASQQWYLAGKPNGKTDIINYATRKRLLNLSLSQDSHNLAMEGTAENAQGFSLIFVAEGNFAVSSVEEDDNLRYLCCAEENANPPYLDFSPECLSLKKVDS